MSRVKLSNPATARVEPARKVVEVADTISGLENPIRQIGLYDPVNNDGQIVFWVQTDREQAIVRASPVEEKSGVDFVPSIRWENTRGRMLPGEERVAQVTISNRGTEHGKGNVRVEIYLSTDTLLDVTDDLLLSAPPAPSFDLPAGAEETLQVLLKLSAADRPGLDREGVRHLIVRIVPEASVRDSDTKDNVAASVGFWMGQIVCVITHGFNPQPEWLPIFGKGPEEFLQTSYALSSEFTTMPRSSTLFEHRISAYVTKWESSKQFLQGFAAFIAGKVCEADGNVRQRRGDTSGARKRWKQAGSWLKRAEQFAKDAGHYFHIGVSTAYKDITRDFLLDAALSRRFQRLHFIGHSRGVGVNAWLANLLSKDGFRIEQFTSLDGYGRDWPDGSGILGDIWILEKARGENLVNYRVQNDLADLVMDRIELAAESEIPNIEKIFVAAWFAELLGVPALAPVEPEVRREIRSFDFSAPERSVFGLGFQDIILIGDPTKGPGFNESDHTNIQQLFLESDSRARHEDRYIFKNFIGEHKDDPLPAGGAALSLLSRLRQKSLPDFPDSSGSEPLGIDLLNDGFADFRDGSFEEQAALLRSVQEVAGSIDEADLLDAMFLATFSPAKILTSLWNVSGSVRLLTSNSGNFVELTQTENTALGQNLILSTGAKSLTFDLAVPSAGQEDILRVTFDGNPLAEIVLTSSSEFRQISLSLTNWSGPGEIRFQLAGPVSETSVVLLDNLAVTYETLEIVAAIPSAGGITLRVAGPRNSRCALERCEKFTDWEMVAVRTNTTGHVEFSTSIRTGSASQFFRVKLLP